MKIRKAVLLLVGVALADLTATNAFSQSTFTATYNFNAVAMNMNGEVDPTPPPTVPGVTFYSFISTGAAANPNANGRFSFTSQPLGGVNISDDFSQFTGSLNVAAYFEVSITPLSLIELQLDTIAFTVQRSGTGIRNYAVRSSVDGYTANLAASINPLNPNLAVGAGNEFQWVFDAQTGANNGSLVTLGLPHANLTSTVTFRFYGWNAEASTGTFSIDNVIVAGQTRNVPEPATGLLLVLGLAAAGLRRLRADKTR